MGAFVAPFFMAGIIPGYAADQALDPLADVDLYRGLYDLTQMWPQGTSSQGSAGMVGIVNPGNGYTDGSSTLVPLLGGKGTGATAELTFSGGKLTGVTLDNEGTNYYEGDVLYFDNTPAGQPAGAGGARIQVLGTGVQLKAQTKQQPQAPDDVEAFIAKATRKQLEQFVVQFGLATPDYTGGINPNNFPSLPLLRQAVTEAWKLQEANK